MTIAHEWPDEQPETRCKWCGTPRAAHNAAPQNCVPRWDEAAMPRPTMTGRSTGDFAADDAGVISARIRELEAERLAAINRPVEAD